MFKKVLFLTLTVFVITACTHTAITEPEPPSAESPGDVADAPEEVGDEEEETITEEVMETPKPPTEADVDALPSEVSVIMKTSMGDITMSLNASSTPFTVANFLNLARSGFYDGIKFHRVIPDFMIQTGDPNSKDSNFGDDGTGGPGYAFQDEVTAEDSIIRGVLAMANSGPGTNGSQFFIVTAEDASWLNGKHTIFGTVTEGMDIADAISAVERDPRDHPIEDVTIESIEIQSGEPIEETEEGDDA